MFTGIPKGVALDGKESKNCPGRVPERGERARRRRALFVVQQFPSNVSDSTGSAAQSAAGAEARKSLPKASATNTGSVASHMSGRLSLRYLPDGFQPSNRAGRGQMSSSNEAAREAAKWRRVRYNDVSERTDTTQRASKRRSSFAVSVATGNVPDEALEKNMNNRGGGKWIRVNGNKALLQLPTAERSLTVISWYANDTYIEVVGRGMDADKLRAIAEGARWK